MCNSFITTIIMYFSTISLCFSMEPNKNELSAMSFQTIRHITADALNPFLASIGQFQVVSFGTAPRDPHIDHRNDKILVRIGDSRLSPVSGVYSNCTANSDIRTIICDARIVDDIIDDFHLDLGSNSLELYRTLILRLILAHELGHIILKHGFAAYHGDETGFSVFRYMKYSKELDADKFAVKLIDSARLDFNAQYGVISDILNSVISKNLCPETFPNWCPCPGYSDPTLCSKIPIGPGLPVYSGESFRIELKGTHPDFLVRFARFLILSKSKAARIMYAKDARFIIDNTFINSGIYLESLSILDSSK
ncbi:hypothetical protein [Pleomorphomonas sp. PLEO]|uniref:hypothetical protein n=1 Tax=Pleomorphomonas sp. PLEO TaxID=3239306 RepID=UPI00351F3B62